MLAVSARISFIYLLVHVNQILICIMPYWLSGQHVGGGEGRGTFWRAYRRCGQTLPFIICCLTVPVVELWQYVPMVMTHPATWCFPDMTGSDFTSYFSAWQSAYCQLISTVPKSATESKSNPQIHFIRKFWGHCRGLAGDCILMGCDTAPPGVWTQCFKTT